MTTDRVHWTGERVVLGETPEAVELEHLQRYHFSSRICHGRILDVACGTGYGSEILSWGGQNPTVGVDISGEALKHARLDSKNAQFVRASVEALPFRKECFDCIVSFETIEHVRSPQTAVAELHRIVRGGGLLLLSTPNRDVSLRLFGGLSSPFHKVEFAHPELRSLLAKNFRRVAILGQGWRRGSRSIRSLDRLVSLISKHTHLSLEQTFLRLFQTMSKRATDHKALGWFATLLGPAYDIGPGKSRKEDRPKFLIAICRADQHRHQASTTPQNSP